MTTAQTSTQTPTPSHRRATGLFSFPDPVNDYAARTVATGVVLLCVLFLTTQFHPLLILLALGFWARVLTGPTLSPLGQLATKVVAPRIGGRPKLVPGPPKRFAQAIGAAFSTTALVLWYGFSLGTAATVVIAVLTAAATLEAAFGICLGCIAFGQLMRLGLIPESICEACADVSRRYATTAYIDTTPTTAPRRP